MYLFLSLPCICLSFHFVLGQADKTLKFVHILWRHGDRNPASTTFPTDVNNPKNTWYNKAWGELTPTGMRQHHQLGMWLRKRYDAFLNSSFDQSQIYIRSTNYNRTIMSALSNMAGLYPPHGIQLWNSNITWQPIPVHTRPLQEDPMLWFNKKCPHEDDIYFNHVLKLPEVQQIDNENADFYKMLSKNTGWEIKNIDDTWKVMDPINCEYLHQNDTNPPRPPMMPWITDAIREKLLELYDISTVYYFYGLSVLRLRGGLLLGDIMDRMHSKSVNDVSALSPNLRFYVYSAHDTTVLGLLKTLGAYNKKAPPYCAAVIFELHQNATDNSWFVKTYYKNDTHEFDGGHAEPYELKVANCTTPCTLHSFIQRGRPYVPTDWYAECGLVQGATKMSWLVPFIVVAGICAVLLLSLLIVSYKLVKHKNQFSIA